MNVHIFKIYSKLEKIQTYVYIKTHGSEVHGHETQE